MGNDRELELLEAKGWRGYEPPRGEDGSTRAMWGAASKLDLAVWEGMLPADKVKPYQKAKRRAVKEGWMQWVRGYADVYAMAEGCYFETNPGAKVCALMECMKLSQDKWAGQPLVLLDWMRNRLLMPLFGWRRANGRRRFRKAFIEVPKKNAKSTLCAGLIPILLAFDSKGAPEVYSAAKTRKQASIVYEEAHRMLKQSKELQKYIKATPSVKKMESAHNNGVFYALSADHESQEGLNIHAAVIDELHILPRKIVETLMYGGVARQEPLFISISTAGQYDPSSIGWETHEYASKILNGAIVDPEFFALIYAADKEDDWTDPRTFLKANPSAPEILKVEDFISLANEAKNDTTKLSAFMRYRLNIWVQAADNWIDMNRWARCGDDFDWMKMGDRLCFGAMDLSHNDDLTAFALCWPPTSKDPFFRVKAFHWVPEDVLPEKAIENNAPYLDWARRGYIRTTPGEQIDVNAIERDIVNILEYVPNIQEINYDPFKATEITQRMESQGYVMVMHRTGTKSFHGPMMDFDRIYRGCNLRHDNDPVLTWEMGNVQAKRDSGGLLRIEKSNVKKKVDGPVCVVMAVGAACARGIPKTAGVYESDDGGLLIG